MRNIKLEKVINFKDESLVKRIQHYANQNHNGNFTAAVREMCKVKLDKELK